MSSVAPLAPFALDSGLEGPIWPPPDSLKRAHLLSLFQRRGHSILIESGTYLGGTVEHFLPHAEGIVSIEIEPTLYRRAAARFAQLPNVTILHGDATDLIPPIFDLLDTPPLVFLDGHFSGGETGCGAQVEPAQTILELLGRSAIPGTTIVVDDLRLFGGDPEFPTLDGLLTTARSAFPGAQITAGVDSLVIAL
jgi:predicted O-methyltransferase YrrM